MGLAPASLAGGRVLDLDLGGDLIAAMHERLATLQVSWRAPVKTMLFAAVREAPEQPAAEVIDHQDHPNPRPA